MHAIAGVSTHYSMELEVKDGVVFARSKPDIDPATKWSPAQQLFPPVAAPDTTPHEPAKSPDLCPLQKWKNADEVKKDLRKFYTNDLRHVTTHIPADVAEGECGVRAAHAIVIAYHLSCTHTHRNVEIP